MPTDSKDKAEQQAPTFRDFTATGTITAGDTVSLLSDGTVQKTDDTNVDNWIGIAKANISGGSAGQICFKGMVADTVTGLTTGSTYYVNYDGTLTDTESDNTYGIIGRALSSTSILLTNIRPKAGEIPPTPPGGALFTGGQITGVQQNDIQTKSFASTATGTTWANLITTVTDNSGTSNLTEGFRGGGRQSSSQIHSVEKLNLTSASNGVYHANLTLAKQNQGSAGTDDDGVFFGGYNNPAGVQNHIDKMPYATATNATSIGTLGTARYTPGAADDRTDALILGGHDGISVYLNISEKKSMLDTSNAVSHGSLSYTVAYPGVVSDNTNVMAMQGQTNGGNYTSVFMKQFASDSYLASHGSMINAIIRTGHVSNWTEALVCGGQTTMGDVNSCELKQFASTATAVGHGNMATIRSAWGSIARY